MHRLAAQDATNADTAVALPLFRGTGESRRMGSQLPTDYGEHASETQLEPPMAERNVVGEAEQVVTAPLPASAHVPTQPTPPTVNTAEEGVDAMEAVTASAPDQGVEVTAKPEEGGVSYPAWKSRVQSESSNSDKAPKAPKALPSPSRPTTGAKTSDKKKKTPKDKRVSFVDKVHKVLRYAREGGN